MRKQVVWKALSIPRVRRPSQHQKHARWPPTNFFAQSSVRACNSGVIIGASTLRFSSKITELSQRKVQTCRKIRGLGCVTHTHIFLHVCTVQ